MASKSKKFNEMVNGFDMLYANLPSNHDRYAKAWHDIYETNDNPYNENGEYEPGGFVDTYHFQAGYEGMPADYKMTFSTPEELEAEMRSFADFRRWNFIGW